MEKMEIKQQMMKLWKDVFHDSDEYVRLIFDSYFNEELVEYEIVDGKIVSALLAIDYKFENNNARSNRNNLEYSNNSELNKCNNITEFNHSLRGLYLCGLSTISDYRGRGIMSKLIERINRKAYIKGYDFTFLIPASESLQLYYNQFGYMNSIRRCMYRFVSGYNFRCHYNIEDEYTENCNNVSIKDDVLCLKSQEDIYNISYSEFAKINEYIYRCDMRSLEMTENSSLNFSLVHSTYDSEILLNECLISGGEIAIFKNKADVIGVLIFSINNDGEIIIPHIYCDNPNVKIEMLSYVSEKYPDNPIVLYDYCNDKSGGAVWQPFYVEDEQSGVDGMVDWRHEEAAGIENSEQNYGMIRVLRGSEILKFASNSSINFKYSILVKDNFSEKYEYFESKNGIFHSRKVTEEEGKKLVKNGTMFLTYPELVALFTRKFSDEDVVELATGLPRLQFNMAYLLD